MIEVAKKKVSHIGSVSLGWVLGHGFVTRQGAVEMEPWCVVENGKVLAECRSKKIAQRMADALSVYGQHA